MHELSNDPVDWDAVDTLLLDMDGTLLDLNFDTYFWLEVIPQAYADAQGRALSEVADALRATFQRHRGTLNWYSIDFWTRTLGLDVMALQRSHAARITYLDGAPEFLATARQAGKQCILVTNADRNTLRLKHERTGVIDRCDEAISSEDFGMPKEHPDFWPALVAHYRMSPARALFIDDTETVLDAAHGFGIGQVVAIARPDSKGPRRGDGAYTAIDGVRDLIELIEPGKGADSPAC